MKRIGRIILSALLLAGLTVSPALAWYGEGPDDWADAEVRAALDSGFQHWETEEMSNGYRDAITRQQFCMLIGTVLGKAKNLDPYAQYQNAVSGGYQSPFSDTANIYWSYDIGLANSLGIVSGTGPNRFEPYATLTREQAAVILANTIKTVKPGLWQEGKDYTAGKNIADKGSVSTWAVNSIGFVMDQGLMSGIGNNKFGPQDPYTVEQAIMTCYRLCKATGVSGLVDAGTNGWLDQRRMNRELYREDGGPIVAYGGFGDGLKALEVVSVEVDGRGTVDLAPDQFRRSGGYKDSVILSSA